MVGDILSMKRKIKVESQKLLLAENRCFEVSPPLTTWGSADSGSRASDFVHPPDGQLIRSFVQWRQLTSAEISLQAHGTPGLMGPHAPLSVRQTTSWRSMLRDQTNLCLATPKMTCGGSLPSAGFWTSTWQESSGPRTNFSDFLMCGAARSGMFELDFLQMRNVSQRSVTRALLPPSCTTLLWRDRFAQLCATKYNSIWKSLRRWFLHFFFDAPRKHESR